MNFMGLDDENNDFHIISHLFKLYQKLKSNILYYVRTQKVE